MGSKTTVHQRQLTPEERALIAQQKRYLDSMQPAVDQLVSRGTDLLGKVYNPDWEALQQYTLGEIDKIRGEQAALARGELPDSYVQNKRAYFNNIYQNTMGQQLGDMARRGVINSSRFSTVNNGMQQNMLAQMSRDFSNDMRTQQGLLSQRWDMAQAPYKLAEATHANSLNTPLTYFNAARGQAQVGQGALGTLGQLNNGRTYATKESGPLDALAGIAGTAAKFF